MESLGEQLRAARQARKVTLEDASRITKIKVEVLEKLEADEFRALPSPIYVRGFLKLYGDYLGLDGTAVADAYLKSQGGLRRHGLQLETEVAMRERQSRQLVVSLNLVVKILVALAVVVLLAVVGRLVWNWRANRQQPRPAPAPVVLPPANVSPYYQPKTPVIAEQLDPAGR